MKLFKFLPSFLRPKAVPVVIPSIEEIQVETPKAPVTPFTGLDDYLAQLVAIETQTKADHDLAVMRLHDYLQMLEDRAKTHTDSIRALYAQPTLQVNLEKAK